MKRYNTIRATARLEDMPSENWLRAACKKGELPGFFAGSRFYVDAVRLAEMLYNSTSANGTQEATT